MHPYKQVSTNYKMQELTIILFTLGLIFSSCNSQLERQEKTNTLSTVELIDSTNYNQLASAYKGKNHLLLKRYFEDWFEYSTKFTNSKSDSLTANLLDIFKAVYHPFELEKYGWTSRPHFSKYEYAIVPTEIKYKLYSPPVNPDTINQIIFDTLHNIFPLVEIGKAKTLYDIQPFSSGVKLFLQNDSYDKLNFLDSYISTPITLDWKGYQTSPEILGIFLNENLNESFVDLRLISTGLRVYLIKKKQKWEMVRNEVLWEE